MTRIFDINGQFYAGESDGLDGYRRLLEQPDIAGLVLSAMDLKLQPSNDFPFMSRFCTSNEAVMDFVAQLGDARVVPFFYVDPRRPDAATQVQQAVRNGFRGVKMYPPLGWYPDEPRVLDAFRAAEEHGVPVFLHMGRTASHPQLRSIYGMPVHLEGLGIACQRLKVIIGHFASPWSREACHIAMSFQFYFDLSTSGSREAHTIRYVARNPYLSVDRLVLGTNGNGRDNLASAEYTIGRLRDCGLTDADIQKVACDNAMKLLGLDAASQQPPPGRKDP